MSYPSETIIVTVRGSVEERAILTAEAKRQGFTLNQWVRHQLGLTARQLKRKPK